MLLARPLERRQSNLECVHPEAAVELAAHVVWYDTHEPGLGTDFELAVYDALANVAAHPQAWPAWEGLILIVAFLAHVSGVKRGIAWSPKGITARTQGGAHRSL